MVLRKQTPDVLECGILIAIFVIGCCESVRSVQSVCPSETGLKSNIKVSNYPPRFGMSLIISKYCVGGTEQEVNLF